MICKRISPGLSVSQYVKEYLLLDMVFDTKAPAPIKAYPVNPEEGMTFQMKGSLIAHSPELNLSETRPKTCIFGQPNARQNYYQTHEFMLVHVRFHPGALYQLLRIPMPELVHKNIDAELILGPEMKQVHDQLANASDYDAIPMILDAFFRKKINRIKSPLHPIDKIGQLIVANPQGFNLARFANEACLSIRQFEKRFVQKIGVTPKYYARICRFYQAYELKEFQPELDWLSIALQTGYSDYQHLVKDFKQFAGTAPNSLIQASNQNPERRLNIATNFRGV